MRILVVEDDKKTGSFIIEREPAPTEYPDCSAVRVTIDGGRRRREIPGLVVASIVQPDAIAERHGHPR